MEVVVISEEMNSIGLDLHNCDVLDNNYYNYRYTSCRTHSADARGKSADGSVNWYTAVTRDGRQWSHLCLSV